MSIQKTGARHSLLFFRRSLDRIGRTTILLSLVLALVGWRALNKNDFTFGINNGVWLFIFAILLFLLGALAFFLRYWAYVRVKSSFLYVVTPLFRFRISYRRIRSASPVLIQQLFPIETSSWSQRNFMRPFYGKTALLVELIGYPSNPMVMRLFLPRQMFSPRSTGLVLMVPDWLKLSTELDTIRGVWLEGQSKRTRYGK